MVDSTPRRITHSLLSRARQPALAGTHPVLCCVAQGWRVLGAGCCVLGAGHFLDADCLGQGIRVGSWLADLFSRCTYNHVPPNFLNTSPIVLLLASGSLPYSTPPILPATPPLSPCFLDPIFLFPVSSQAPYHSSTRPVALSVRPTTSPYSPRITSHIPSFRGSHQSYRAWQPSKHHRAASLGSRCHRASTGLSLRTPPIPEVRFSLGELRYGYQRRTAIKGLSASHLVNK